jgi:hypothetical protein
MLPKKQGLYSPEFEHDNCGAGFICSLKGVKSNDIIHKALEILEKLEHRGAVSADGRTGDGAGILINIPHDYFQATCDFTLPKEGTYAVSNVFLPRKENQRAYCISVFEKSLSDQGINILGWRDVPVDQSILGEIAQVSEPFVKQIFVSYESKGDNSAFAKAQQKPAPIAICTWGFSGATEKAGELLTNGASALDAIIAGVAVEEENIENTTVGIGATPDREGNVTLDACVMNPQGDCGAVLAVENIVNVAALARKVMEDTPHVILAG